MPIRSDSERHNPSAHKCIDGKTYNISKTYNENETIQARHISLNFFILFYIILLPAAASSLSISAPPEVDVSGEGAYEMNFICSDDARSLSALVRVPEGFSYTGNAKIVLNGMQSSCEPYQSGQISTVGPFQCAKILQTHHINEWEQNPEGTDTLKEWIELYNPTSQAVNVGGWKLFDSYYGKIVAIPSGTVIMPDGYQRLTWTNGSLINSYKTCISLLDSAGRVVDRTSSAKDDKSNNLCWARYPNGKDLDSDLDWKFQAATPGSSNGGSSCRYLCR